MFPWQKGGKSDVRKQPWLSQSGKAVSQHPSKGAVSIGGLRLSQRLQQPLPDSLRDRLTPVQRYIQTLKSSESCSFSLTHGMPLKMVF